MFGGQRGLDLVVVPDLAGRGVHQEHPAGLQPALGHHGRRVEVDHAGLAGQHHQPVRGPPPAAGAQAVAVQHRADHRAVGEGHAGRPVPGLHQAGVEGVEVPPRLDPSGRRSPRPPGSSSAPRAAGCGRPGAAAPAPRRRRPNRTRRACRSGTAGPAPPARPASSSLASSDCRLSIQFRLPPTVLISPLCAIIRNGWASGQDGKVLVENLLCTRAIARREVRIGQVRVEAGQLRGGEHSLVHQGSGRQRREVQLLAGLAGQPFGHLAQRECLAFQGNPGQSGRRRRRTAARRPASPTARSGRGRSDRSAPAASRAPSAPRRPRSRPPVPCTRCRAGSVSGQEGDAGGVAARRRQFEAGHHPAQEAVRDRHRDARPVAAGRLGAGRAAMVHVVQGDQRVADQFVAGPARAGRPGRPPRRSRPRRPGRTDPAWPGSRRRAGRRFAPLLPAGARSMLTQLGRHAGSPRSGAAHQTAGGPLCPEVGWIAVRRCTRSWLGDGSRDSVGPVLTGCGQATGPAVRSANENRCEPPRPAGPAPWHS